MRETLHVLFIDSYDSFTYNLVRLIEQQNIGDNTSIKIITIHNDTITTKQELIQYAKIFDAIVVGPGPGNPINGTNDIGVISSLFCDELQDVPILGVCLGFQALCFYHGAKIEELKTIKHGQVYPITIKSDNDELFKGIPSHFKSTRYHSLHVTNITPQIVPLATTTDENGELLMAARIKDKPWYGVQYHPESCSSEFGEFLISNFLSLAIKNNKTLGRTNWRNESKWASQSNPELASKSMFKALEKKIDRSTIYDKKSIIQSKEEEEEDLITMNQYNVTKDPQFTFKLCDKIRDHKFIMASSSVSKNRGEWSIIALPNENSKVFTHYNDLNKTTIHKWQDKYVTSKIMQERLHQELKNEKVQGIDVISEDKSQFWTTIGEFMKSHLIPTARMDLPFIGGLVGILGYEMGSFVKNNKCDETVDLTLKPDAKLVFIENTILINHETGELYTISLKDNFPHNITALLDKEHSLDEVQNTILPWERELPKDINYEIMMPEKKDYTTAFNKCQEYMHKGDSYEICLTTQTKVIPSEWISPWRIFQTLIQRNPAPFSNFFQFQDIIDDKNPVVLLSTSPERFLKWNKDTCELRPIKGTVKKTEDMTLEKATSILKTPKEFGENLMILDLIRNDLYELLPDVRVEEFMSVEEYATVYQLVSVIKAYGLNESKYSGIDILKHSLPPGSMTGAPKKITVELLQEDIEKGLNKDIYSSNRGIYSGISGYWSVNGNGDWSVNIRCMYSYNNGKTWQLGAGGAITVLSTLEGELEEMYTKLETGLQIFT
ncbi:4-amino-4-deoxychorismate synthase NDAI_0K02240 [Naumovozyma dairenensis CBS 421]|uniref:aminodeoxychorismate synthase n=1 Tax=Naumovozyma dairenensis (strain ATCC 10597 / BCRC 20456 / CBS 421 / NBRC 0211 / NRRL Y-12639) TaxID=1071378 RepID=G0WI04_NAUDC|nr:hypothetical protein NDAI_0K02240 [Naumovozyma dairenensis CBS 421]CCD27415.1 hypothetical protein NDAI_0K02240 [Naumovozyma dairenensis CBS 421]